MTLQNDFFGNEPEHHPFTLEDAERKGDEGQDYFLSRYRHLPHIIRKAAGPLEERPRHGDKLGRPDYSWSKIDFETEYKNQRPDYVMEPNQIREDVTDKRWTAKHRANLWQNHIRLPDDSEQGLQETGITPLFGFGAFLTYLLELLGGKFVSHPIDNDTERQDDSTTMEVDGLDPPISDGINQSVNCLKLESNSSVIESNSLSLVAAESSKSGCGGLMAHDGTDFCIACLQLEGRWHVNDSASPELVEPDF